MKKIEKRKLYKNKNTVFTHWHTRHNERDYQKLLKIAEYELYNFTWIATVNTFIKEGNISDKKKILDIGFGWGRTIVGLKKKITDLDVTGIELVDRAIENAQVVFKKYLPKYSKINLEIGDAERLRFEDNSFDTVLSTRVFQYLTNPQKAFHQVHRVLVPGGKAVIMVPNKLNPHQYLWYHTQPLSFFTLKKWFKEAGFKNIKNGSIIYFNDKWHRFSSDSAWVEVERLLTKIPFINKIGGNVWVSGEK